MVDRGLTRVMGDLQIVVPEGRAFGDGNCFSYGVISLVSFC